MSGLPINGPYGTTLVTAQTKREGAEWDAEEDVAVEIQIAIDSDMDGRDEVELTVHGNVYSILLADLLGALGKELDK